MTRLLEKARQDARVLAHAVETHGSPAAYDLIDRVKAVQADIEAIAKGVENITAPVKMATSEPEQVNDFPGKVPITDIAKTANATERPRRKKA